MAVWSVQARLAPYTTTAEAQRYEPGANQLDACGPACVSVLMQGYGYSDIEPQDLVGSTYVGPTNATQLQEEVKAHYTNPPSVVVTGGLPMDAYGEDHYGIICLLNCNAAAEIQPYYTGIFHWCIVLGNDGSRVTIWNPEWGLIERYTYDFFNKAFAGTLIVFLRALSPTTTNSGGKKMLFLRNKDTGDIYIFGDAGHRKLSLDEWNAWSASGAKYQDTDSATIAKILAA